MHAKQLRILSQFCINKAFGLGTKWLDKYHKLLACITQKYSLASAYFYQNSKSNLIEKTRAARGHTNATSRRIFFQNLLLPLLQLKSHTKTGGLQWGGSWRGGGKWVEEGLLLRQVHFLRRNSEWTHFVAATQNYKILSRMLLFRILSGRGSRRGGNGQRGG